LKSRKGRGKITDWLLLFQFQENLQLLGYFNDRPNCAAEALKASTLPFNQIGNAINFAFERKMKREIKKNEKK